MGQKIKAILTSMIRQAGTTANIDRFRETFGSWQASSGSEEEQYIKYSKNPNKPYEIQPLDPSFQINYFVVPTTGNASIPFIEQIYRKQTYKIVRNDNSYPSVRSVIPFDYRFTNFAMEGETRSGLSQDSSIEIKDFGQSTSYSDVDFIYKSENIEYEDLAATVYGQEKALPNYYGITMWNRDLSPNNDLVSFINTSIQNYYSDPVKNLKFSNIIVPCDNMDLINEGNQYINEQKQNIFSTHEILDGVATRENTFSQIPYYAHIRLSNDVEKNTNTIGISGQLENTKFIRNNIMFFPKETITPIDQPDETSYDNNYDLSGLLTRWHLQNKKILNENTRITYTLGTSQPSSDTFYSYELINWLNRFAPSVLGSFPADMSYVGTEKTACSRMLQPTQTKMALVQYTLKKILNAFSRIDVEDSSGKFVNFLPTLYSAKTMIECGGLGINETLFYKIEKFIGAGTNTKSLQTIIVPQSDYTTEYIDTQISYDSLYTYKVSEVKAVLYCEYEYKRDSFYSNDITLGEDIDYIDVYQYPRIRIVEIPTLIKSGRILANPPNIPQIKVLPIRRNSNKFRILFQNNYGSSMGDVRNLLLSNNSTSYQELLNRKTSIDPMIALDDKVSISSFHIFYTTEDSVLKNTDYSDLVDKQLLSVDTGLTDSATAKLSIKPNKKYYMSFVSLNRLGLASPGSPIYEFKIISDSGLNYLDFKLYEGNLESLIYKSSKSAHKFISVSPSSIQGFLDDLVVYPNEDTTTDGLPSSKRKPVSFGRELQDALFPQASIGEGKVLGKKIKLRIKSKNTNQIFDINLAFKHERVESTFDKNITTNTLMIEPTENPNTGANEISLMNGGFITLGDNNLTHTCGKDDYAYIDFYYPEKPKNDPRPEDKIVYIPDTGYPDISYPDPSTPLPTPPGISGVYPPTQGLGLLMDPNGNKIIEEATDVPNGPTIRY